MFEHALRPGSIGSLRLPNRIVMGSMHLGIESDAGALGAFYAERARGGAGLIVTGGSAVNRTGAGGRNYSFINDAASAEVLARAARAVHEAGGRVALQLFHAGRYAYESSFGLQPVAPSAVPSRFSPDPPRALDEAEILETIDDFARGAAHAKEIGFDAVEVMASEGYLLNQFLSPLTNRREDAWGGDFERRGRTAARSAQGDPRSRRRRLSGDLSHLRSRSDEWLDHRGADAGVRARPGIRRRRRAQRRHRLARIGRSDRAAPGAERCVDSVCCGDQSRRRRR